ncbi:hypothetical protein AAHB57_29740 [Bacillus cereus]
MPWFFAYGISTNPEQMVKDIGGYKNYKKAVLENYIYTFTGYHEDFKGEHPQLSHNKVEESMV